MYLYLVVEVVTSGYKTLFLFILSLISVFFGIMIVTAKNPVVSVLYLIGLFTAISLYLMALGMYFVGLSYLLVYVGAISILFLFILMLLNVRVSELLTEGVNSVPLAIIAVLVFSFNINNTLPHYLYISDAFSKYVREIVLFITAMFYLGREYIINKLVLMQTAIIDAANVNSKLWDGSLVDINHITSIGNILYSNLFILLIIISLILLLAMVGTIIITTKRETTGSSVHIYTPSNGINMITLIIGGVIYVIDCNGLLEVLTPEVMCKSLGKDMIGLSFYAANLLAPLGKLPSGFFHDVITVFAHTGDIPEVSSDSLADNVTEVNRLLNQLERFINAFNEFVRTNELNIAVQDNNMAIDAQASVPDAQIEPLVARANILNNLIHNRYNSIVELINAIKDSDQHESLTNKLSEIAEKYKHFDAHPEV